MQPAKSQSSLVGLLVIHGLTIKVTEATSLNGVIRGSVALAEASYPWEESFADPESATDADQYLEMNIELLDAIWQKLVVSDVDHLLDLESVINSAATEISKTLRTLIADSSREATKDLFSSAGN